MSITTLFVRKSKIIADFSIPTLIRIEDEKSSMREESKLAEVDFSADVVHIDTDKRMSGRKLACDCEHITDVVRNSDISIKYRRFLC